MRKHSTVTLLFIAVILIPSCRSFRHIYSPAPANNPAFREKGESELAILYSGADGNNGAGDRQKNEGVDILAAYAITDHWAVTGSFFARKERDIYNHNFDSGVFDSSVVNYKRRATDFGIGYFTPFDNRKKSTFSFYVGFSSGHFNINDRGLDDTMAVYTRFYEADLRKLYFQPGFHFWFNDYLSMEVTLRYSFIRYTHAATSYTQREQEYFFLDKIKHGRLTNLEPTLGILVGIPRVNWVKIYASTTGTTGWLPRYPSTRSINGSVGLTIDLSKLSGQRKVSK